MSELCESCGQILPPKPARVSITGLYDCHLFTGFEGHTVDEVIDNWRKHNATPNPAIVGGHKVNDLGPADLCPAIVIDGNGKELRRVGKMIFWKGEQTSDAEVQRLRTAWLEDPDIPFLLAGSGA